MIKNKVQSSKNWSSLYLGLERKHIGRGGRRWSLDLPVSYQKHSSDFSGHVKIIKPFLMSYKALHDLAPPPSDHLSSSSLTTVNLLLSFEHTKLISVSRPSRYVFQLEDLRLQSPSGCLLLAIVSPPQNGTPLDQPKTIPPSDHSLSHYHILLSP